MGLVNCLIQNGLVKKGEDDKIKFYTDLVEKYKKEFNLSDKEAQDRVVKEVREDTLNSLHDIYHKAGVKGFEEPAKNTKYASEKRQETPGRSAGEHNNDAQSQPTQTQEPATGPLPNSSDGVQGSGHTAAREEAISLLKKAAAEKRLSGEWVTALENGADPETIIKEIAQQGHGVMANGEVSKFGGAKLSKAPEVSEAAMKAFPKESLINETENQNRQDSPQAEVHGTTELPKSDSQSTESKTSGQPEIGRASTPEEKEEISSRQGAKKMLDVLMAAKKFTKKTSDEMMHDPEVLKAMGVKSFEDLTDEQKEALHDIHYMDKREKQDHINIIRKALRGKKPIADSIHQGFEDLKAKTPGEKLVNKDSLSETVNPNTGETEQTGERISGTQMKEEQNFINDLHNWKPVYEEKSQRIQQEHDLKMLGRLMPGVSYSKEQLKIAQSHIKMAAFIMDNFSKLGPDRFLDTIRMIMDDPRQIDQRNLNAFLTTFLQMDHLYPKAVMDRIALFNHEIGSNTSEGLNLRQIISNKDKMNDVMQEMFNSGWGDKSKQAGEMQKNLRELARQSAEDVESVLHDYVKGMNEEEGAKAISDLFKALTPDEKPMGGDALKSYIADTHLGMEILKRTYSPEATKADEARKGVIEGLRNKIKRIKC